MPYHKVGTTYRDTIVYVSGGSSVTGLTSGDFTIELSKNLTGNQSATGITLAEVDDTNNAGEYSVEVNGTTGFVSAVGDYSLVIYRTSVPSDRWYIDIRVTGTGTGETESDASAEFTATASDGHIMAGASPLQGASVILRTSGGTVVTETVSDASGLWGPVYLAETVTAYIQKAGYQQTTGTITVSGDTATGPAADLSLTATSSAGGLTASSLWAYARRQARDRVGSKADTEIEQLVNDAQMMVAKAADWQHLQKVGEIVLRAHYNTGTVAVTNDSTTVTLSAGTFPSWAASGEIAIGSKMYRIASRDSDTQITLSTAWSLTSDASSTYDLIQYRYDLAADFLQFGTILQGQNWPYGARPTSYKELVGLVHTWRYTDSRTRAFSIANSDLIVYPVPSADNTITYTYKSRPADLNDSSDTSDWDANHLELLHRAIDYQVSLRYGETAAGMTYKQCESAFKRALASCVPNDRDVEDLPSPAAFHRGRHSSRYIQVPDGS